ncbi:MAG: YecA family protein [Rhodobacteraceae bacterium]|nr:YecA family protein [Paracoccaceae bacterium]
MGADVGQGYVVMQEEIDLDRLDEWLSSDDSPENCMCLSDLDGFMHGIVCGPVMISVEEWLPIALGGDPSDVPPFAFKSGE